MNRFGFIDSSGIINQDRFFGVGLLFIKNIGGMVNELAKNYQAAFGVVKNNKESVINEMVSSGKSDEVIKMLKKSRRFEMKFDNVRPSTTEFYSRMIDIFFLDRDNRFSAMIIDKEVSGFDGSRIQDSWEAYTGYSATLVMREMRNLMADKLCIIVDEITKPNIKPLSLEETFLSKLKAKCSKIQQGKFSNVFGAISIESHSNQLMQLTDVLLGAVMYDFKKKAGLASNRMERKKEVLVQKLRGGIGKPTLAQSFTIHSPLYFSVFEAKWPGAAIAAPVPIDGS